jgi:putative lipoprotein (rSAM/lipoprotein system)
MNTNFLRHSNKLISFILSILGVGAACTFLGCEYGTPAVEYGVPNASFKVHGTITDGNSKTIKDIQVIMERDTTYSDSEGINKVT